MNTGSTGSTILALAMIAAFLLLVGGARLARQPQERRRGALMIVAALAILGNVLIWAWPTAYRIGHPGLRR